jgi:hypothetical protein
MRAIGSNSGGQREAAARYEAILSWLVAIFRWSWVHFEVMLPKSSLPVVMLPKSSLPVVMLRLSLV